MSTDDQQGIVIIIALLFYFIVLGVPIMQIISKAGYSRAWVLILFIPIVNLIMLWIFAFSRWPRLAQAGYGQPQYPYTPPPGQPYPHGQYPQQPPYQPPR